MQTACQSNLDGRSPARPNSPPANRPATFDVEPSERQDRQVNFAVELRKIETGKLVLGKRPIKHSIHLGELPIVAEERIEPESQVDHVVGFDRILEHQVVLVSLPLVSELTPRVAGRHAPGFRG